MAAAARESSSILKGGRVCDPLDTKLLLVKGLVSVRGGGIGSGLGSGDGTDVCAEEAAIVLLC